MTFDKSHMSLEEFVLEEIARVLTFKKWYKEQAVSRSDDYPLQRHPCDWDEQLMMFVEE